MGSGSSGYGIVGTRGSRDRGYAGGMVSRSVGDNVADLQLDYPIHDGRFGVKGNSAAVRRIESDNPVATAENFYRRISQGGTEFPILADAGKSIKGVVAKMADGTYISYRPVSSSPDASPSILIDVDNSIDPGGLKTHKIHFVQRRKD